MISVCKAEDRWVDRKRKREVWHTFRCRPRPGGGSAGFGVLEVLDEEHLPPGSVVPRLPRRASEVLTYVREGALAHEDSRGWSGVIHAGEFQQRVAEPNTRTGETNASRTDWAHVFQVWLAAPAESLEPCGEQKRFSVAERRGGLCLIASPDAREGSLRLHQDARVYSAVLDRGQHVVHELHPGRRAWLHLVDGEVALGDVRLATGDGVGVSGERTVSMTARQPTEVLLVDLAEEPAWTAQRGSLAAPGEDPARDAAVAAALALESVKGGGHAR